MTTSTEHVAWKSNRSKPERYSNNCGGDNQVSDIWFIRLHNQENYSTVDVNVYVVGYPDPSEDGTFEEYGIEACFEWSEWEDAEREVEGYQDVTYEHPDALAYTIDDYWHPSVNQIFETVALGWVKNYLHNAERDIWWDGHSTVNT